MALKEQYCESKNKKENKMAVFYTRPILWAWSAFKPACVHADKNDWNSCSVASRELVMDILIHMMTN